MFCLLLPPPVSETCRKCCSYCTSNTFLGKPFPLTYNTHRQWPSGCRLSPRKDMSFGFSSGSPITTKILLTTYEAWISYPQISDILTTGKQPYSASMFLSNASGSGIAWQINSYVVKSVTSTDQFSSFFLAVCHYQDSNQTLLKQKCVASLKQLIVL